MNTNREATRLEQRAPTIALHAVLDAGHANFAGAMSAAIEGAIGLDAMADDLAIAVLAFRGQGVNGAFEAIEIARNAVDENLDRLVVFVAATFASSAAVAIRFANI